jgi:hypothetical protein
MHLARVSQFAVQRAETFVRADRTMFSLDFIAANLSCSQSR